MGDKDGSDDKAGKSKAVANLLHGRSSGAQSRRGNVGSAVNIDDSADGDVSNSDERLADEQRASIVSRVAHLSSNGEEGGSSSVGKNKRRDSRDGLSEGRVVGELVVRDPDSLLRGIVRAVLDSDGNGHGEDGCENADHADPGKPRDAAESLDTGEEEAENSGHSDEGSGTGAVSRNRIKTDRNTEHARASHEDPVCQASARQLSTRSLQGETHRAQRQRQIPPFQYGQTSYHPHHQCRKPHDGAA